MMYKYGKLFFCVLMCFTTQSGAGTRESLETLDYTEREHHSWKDDILVFKGKQNQVQELAREGTEKGKNLISEAEQEEYEVKIFSKNVRNCLRRLNDFIEKLE